MARTKNTPPKTLDAEARKKWREVLPILSARGETDQAALDGLAAYCQAWSRWIQAEAKIIELGPVVKSPSGFPVQNPYVAIAKAAQVQLRQWAGELRLTPARRRANAKDAKAKTTPATKPKNDLRLLRLKKA